MCVDDRVVLFLAFGDCADDGDGVDVAVRPVVFIVVDVGQWIVAIFVVVVGELVGCLLKSFFPLVRLL